MKKKTIAIGAVSILTLCAFTIAGCGDETQNTNTNTNTQSTQKNTQPKVTYEDVSASTLMDDLESNAAAANKKYLDRNLRITGGIVRHIDSSGDSFNMTPATSHHILTSIHVSVEDKKVQDELTQVTKGGAVVVYGQVTRVGDTLGYSVTAKKIEVPQN